MIVFSEGTQTGVGIYNHVMTSAAAAQTEYYLRFYKTGEDGTDQLVKPEADMEIGSELLKRTDSSDTNNSATISMGKDMTLIFSDNAAFKSFVKENEINRIVIEYKTGMLDLMETSLLYSAAQQVYDLTLEGNQLDYESDDPFAGVSLYPVEFDSTLMTDFTVEQEWRDRGDTNRPDIAEVTFDIMQGTEQSDPVGTYITGKGTGAEGDPSLYYYVVGSGDEAYKVYRRTEKKSSTLYQYHYTLPETDAHGNPYVYSSVQDFAEIFSEDHYVDGTDGSKQDHYLAVGLTEFQFDMTWADAYDRTARPAITAQYIRDNFSLWNKNTGTEVDFLPEDADWSDYIEITDGADGTHVRIMRLEDINAGGTANEYYLKRKNNELTLPVSPDAELASQSDCYVMKSENPGLHVNETDQTYDNGELQLLLTGTTDFTGHVEWRDSETAQIRENDTEAASFTLWRYTLTGEDDDEEFSANYSDIPVLSGTADSFSANGLAKYDIKGQLYVYYAVESVSVDDTSTEDDPDDMLPYQIIYPDGGDKLLNGETVINKLSDKIEYTVSAEWIAAARQGGTASAEYQLQRRNSGDDSWKTVQSLTLTFDELHMYRKGDDTCKFDEVDIYDTNGDRYEYRVVQISVTRQDQLTDDSNVTDTDNTRIGEENDSGEITVNDRYDVELTRNDTDFHFRYTIKGDTFVNIEKIWQDENGDLLTTDSSYGAVFDVQNFDYQSQAYRDYFVVSEFPENYFSDYIADGYFTAATIDGKECVRFNSGKTTFTDGDWEENGIAVPKYDSRGREIDYRAVEVSKEYPETAVIDGVLKNIGFYSTYEWNVEYTGENELVTNYNYIVTNHRTVEGNDHKVIAVNKEWVDDGELEYRQPINIIANNVGSHIVTTGEGDQKTTSVVQDGERAVLLKKENVWEGRINVSRYRKDGDEYVVDEDGHYELLPFDYQKELFAEAPEGENADGYYWSWEDIERDFKKSGALEDGYEWIYRLLTANSWSSGEESISFDPASHAGNYIDLTEDNFVNFEQFAGIYKSKPMDGDPKRCHYYAVRQVYDPNGVNGADGTLHFINTRIGVISYEVEFDWNVGEALANKDIQSVTIRISDPADNTSITQTITFDQLDKNSDGSYSYYILNLPKYSTDGKLIDYQIEEIKIDDNTVQDGEVTISTGDRCKVDISSETIIEGAEARTDDLHRIVITNSFEDETDITVHKRWYDNSNAENTRSDLYIRLHRISAAPEAQEQSSNVEYLWDKDEVYDTDNYWTYTFDHLAKYDKKGYKYTYYVTEQTPESGRLPGYQQIYSNKTGNDKVYITDTLPNVAYDDGTIINRLYGEVVVEGEKLWKNVSTLLEKADYPIANVDLLRDNNFIETEKLYENKSLAELDGALRDMGLTAAEVSALTTRRQKINMLVGLVLESMTPDEKSANIRTISSTEVRSGATAFRFTEVKSAAVIAGGFVVLDNGNVKKENGSIVLPKYDEAGRRITYTMKETPINGYISKIEQGSQRLSNEYNGGRKLSFDVTKNWEGMEEQTNYPTVTFTLHQVFRANRGTEDEPDYQYYVYNEFKREIRGGAPEKVSFPDPEHPEEADSLRYYSPVGTPFIYFVTETLSNYDGERVVFIEQTDDMENYIGRSAYLSSFSDDDVLTLGADAEALGFTASVTDTLDEEKTRLAALTESELSDTKAEPYLLQETMCNTYQPDIDNFQGEIAVTKSWDTQKEENTLNSEFDSIKAYDFTISRKTRLSDKETLFSVRTIDSHSGENAMPAFSELADGFSMSGSNNTVTAHDFLPSMTKPAVTAPTGDEKPLYYIGVLLNGREAVTVVIDVANQECDTDYHNTVHITGLAIYGHDALKYTYTVEEGEKSGFTAVKGSDSSKLEKNEEKTMQLSNKLDVFNIRLYKSFGREYQDENDTTFIEPIPEGDLEQFFNNVYFEQLTFNLYRTTDPDTPPDSAYKTVKGSDIGFERNAGANFDQEKNAYYYVFDDLPIMDENGDPYTYWVQETDGAQSVSDDKIFTVYSDTFEGSVKEAVVKPEQPSDTPVKITASENEIGETTEKYVQNVFKAKKIAINKYWLDNNNEDGLRPNELKVTITEHVPENGTAASSDIGIERTLKKEQGTDTTGWHMEAALARYYFNGTTAVEGLEYKIEEEDLTSRGYEVIVEPGIYGGGTDPNSYTIPGTVNGIDIPVSDTQLKQVTETDSLNITNYKKPQKGKLELTPKS